MKVSTWMLVLCLLLGLASLDTVMAQGGKNDKGDKGKDKDDEDEDMDEDEDEVEAAVEFEGEVVVEMDNSTMTEDLETLNDLGCPGLDFDADCEACLEAGCVMTVGDCLADCSVMDVACWDMQYHPNKTAADVCLIMTQQEADAAICGDPEVQTCETCTSTVRSDGESTCGWYENYCGTGDACDFQGTCPMDTCEPETMPEEEEEPAPEEEEEEEEEPAPEMEEPETEPEEPEPEMEETEPEEETETEPEAEEVAELETQETPAPTEVDEMDEIADEMPATATVQPSVVDVHPCNNLPGCEQCLNSRIECAWIADSCEPSCDVIADAACYHPSNFANLTGPEICAIANTTEEVSFDGQTGGPCTGFQSCEPCLNSRIDCAWVSGTCLTPASCQVIQDETCYHPSQPEFLNMTGPEICAASEVDATDLEVNRAASDETTNGATSDAADGSFLQTVVTLLAFSALLSMKQFLY